MTRTLAWIALAALAVAAVWWLNGFSFGTGTP